MSKFTLVLAGAFCAVLSAVAINTQSVFATNNTSCVDGSKRSNLSVTWNSTSKVSVHTVNNKPLCADTTLYFSSYTMPDNYNGGPFTNNPTATPQSIFSSKSVALKKGTTGTAQLSIQLPAACKNIQVDLYYAPEIKTVGPAGHGSQYITGKIIKKTVNECTPTTPPTPEEPKVPTPEAQTPPTPAPEVKVAAPAPKVEALPETGVSVAGIVAASALVAGTAYAVTYAASKRQ